MYPLIAATYASSESKTAFFNRYRDRLEKTPSTAFLQNAEVGVSGPSSQDGPSATGSRPAHSPRPAPRRCGPATHASASSSDDRPILLSPVLARRVTEAAGNYHDPRRNKRFCFNRITRPFRVAVNGISLRVV